MSEYTALDARDRDRFVFHATPLRRFAVALARLIFRPALQLDVSGLAQVPAGGFVLATNHLSNWDVFAMQLALPRPIFFMGKAELFKFPLLGALLRDFGAFPVYRGGKDAWALKHARSVLDAGQVLGMFPEGHRSRGRGLGPAKIGTARLAIECHCPIVPMVVIGTDVFLRSFPRRTQVSVSLLEPIQASLGESAEELTARLMYALANALPASMRGVYADRATDAFWRK